MLIQTSIRSSDINMHAEHSVVTPFYDKRSIQIGIMPDQACYGREPDGVTSCYPIPQDGGANRTKVGQSIFSI